MYQLRWCLEKRWDRTLPIYLFRDFSFARISRMLRMRPYEQCFATHSPVPRGHWGREAFIPDTPVIKIVAHRAASEFWFEKRIKKKNWLTFLSTDSLSRFSSSQLLKPIRRKSKIDRPWRQFAVPLPNKRSNKRFYSFRNKRRHGILPGYCVWGESLTNK